MRMALVDPAGIVVGLLDWDTAATFTPQPGYVLRPAGDAHVGDTGTIPNSALTSPLLPGVIWDYIQGFAMTKSPTMSVLKVVTITVPAGMTKVSISMTSRVWVVNPNTTGGLDGVGGDRFSSKMTLNGDPYTGGFYLPSDVRGNLGSALNIATFSTVLEPLTPGSTFTIEVNAATFYAPMANAISENIPNTCEISGSLQWYR